MGDLAHFGRIKTVFSFSTCAYHWAKRFKLEGFFPQQRFMPSTVVFEEQNYWMEDFLSYRNEHDTRLPHAV